MGKEVALGSGYSKAVSVRELMLFASNLTATVIDDVSVILVARLSEPTYYDTYSLALVIQAILQLFVGFGALPAVVRYVTYYDSARRQEEAKRFTVNVMIFVLLRGSALTIITLLLAGSLLPLALHRPEL